MRNEVQFEGGDGYNLLYGDVNGHEILATIKLPEGEEVSEDYGYLTLKRGVIYACEKEEISLDGVRFWYDGQEDHLSEDADVNANINVGID